MLNRQRLIAWLEEQFATLPDVLRQLPGDPALEAFRASVVEGTDAAFLIFLDALEDDDPESWEFVVELMGRPPGDDAGSPVQVPAHRTGR